ncbi:MAG: hypothetical protein SVM80_08160 [Halobacteriota archaeon]|nr:hypothetical protein [Halobacteriota archaeon]
MPIAVWDGVAVEAINLIAGLLLLLIAIYARQKFNFSIFRLGWNFIALSGIVKVIASSFRIYYAYYELYELIPYGRALLVVGRILTVIGVYLLASAAIKLWGET